MITVKVQTPSELDEILKEFLLVDGNLWEAISKKGTLSKDTEDNIKNAILQKDIEYLGIIIYSQVIVWALQHKENDYLDFSKLN